MRCIQLVSLCMAASRFESICIPPGHIEVHVRRVDSEEGAVCQFKSIIEHISYVSARGGELYALVDPKMCDGNTVDCCTYCFNKCIIFSQIEKEMDDYSFRYAGVANLSFLQRREGKYLACRGRNGHFLVVVNRNAVPSVNNQILLVCMSPAIGEGTDTVKLFECTDILEGPGDVLVATHSLCPKLPRVLLEDVGEDCWWPVGSLGTLVMGYYALGTFLVLMYYSLRTKDHG